jgi:hypothetical protein
VDVWIAPGLFALALLIFLAVLRRVGRIERRLEGALREEQVAALVRPLDAGERLRALEELLRGLRDQVAHLPPPLAAGDLTPLADRIARLEVVLGDLRIRIDEQRARTAYTSDDEGGLPGRMRRSLAQRGYEMVHVLSDVMEGATSEELRIPVEARRAGMTFKGTVTVADGRITDVALKPANEVFP